MNIDEMIQQLEEARDDLGGDAEVRIAYQPNWPLRGTVAAVTVPQDDSEPHCADHTCFVGSCHDCQEAMADADERGDGDAAPGKENDSKMLWLAVGSAPWDENPYAPRWAWQGEA